jgi:hypothetical protein
MKRTAILGVAVACALTLFGCAAEQQAGNRSEQLQAPLTTQDVTAMSKAGISDSVIVTMIGVSGSRFNLSANDVIALADSGVSPTVINAMIKTADHAKQAYRANAVYVYPWYPYYAYPYYFYDPFCYPWYYPGYSLSFGFSYGHHGGFAGHRGGGVRRR